MSITGFGSIPKEDSNRVRLDELVDLYQFQSDYETVRFIGPLWSYVEFWFKIRTKSGTIVPIRKLCLDYDHDHQIFSTDVCPYRKAELKGKKIVLGNAIVRRLQEDEPKNHPKPTQYESIGRRVVSNDPAEFVLKEKGSRSWTPVRVVRVTGTLCEQLTSLVDLNRRTSKKTGEVRKYELAHPQFGMDVELKVNKPAKGAMSYHAQRGEPSALTEEEQKYLLYKLDVEKVETPEKAKQEWANLKAKLVGEEETELAPEKKAYYDDAGEDAKTKYKASADNDPNQIDPEDSFGMDDLEDETPKKKKKGWDN
jgi:hypothetical protein